MINPRLILCSGVRLENNDPRTNNRQIIELDGLGPDPNVHIRLEDVAKVFLRHLSPRLLDLLEIASYIYTADCATGRGREWTDDHATEAWARDFYFIIPVRDICFWKRPEIIDLLRRVLKFLSDDEYQFDFEELQSDRPTQEYLEFSDLEDWPFYGVERVLMFSGGLDSLAGAVIKAACGDKLVLVSHRSVGKISKRQCDLFEQLQKVFTNPMIHIPVWINKDKPLGREHTQRTRSFLYSALGTVVAESIKANGVSFFENGIVSLNLPVADEVLRARASRTTHPYPLSLLSEFYRSVTEREFIIDNPFIFKTKADVISVIADNDAVELIKYTCSCAHTGYFSSKSQWHCGTCSQCIDRRIAIIATKQEKYDPDFDYVLDVFTGSRKDGHEQNMAVNYAKHALELCKMNEEEIASKFNLELSRAARPFSNRRETVEKFIQIHKHHGQIVNTVLIQQLKMNANKLVNGELEQKSMLGLIAGQKHLPSSWKRFADRIIDILRSGLPIACRTDKPNDEPHLQEICDALLRAEDSDLVREYPFMRWSSSLTKPDWSSEEFRLWVELKYVREKRNIHKITEDISSDITKYGDNLKNVLYLIYDPHHLITDEYKFSEHILTRQTMQVAFLR